MQTPPKKIGGILSDTEITKLCVDTDTPMISPFSPKLIDKSIISYGLSSMGYDATLAPEYKIFKPVEGAIVDPKNFNHEIVDTITGPEAIIPPNGFLLGYTAETFAIPKDILSVCLGKSTYARCFTGDTRVALIGGESASFLEMMEGAAQGKRYFGYAVNKDNRVVVQELVAPRCVGDDTITVVTLASGEEVHCTSDHTFLRKHRARIEAANLTRGQTLFPLYRTGSNSEELVFQPESSVYTTTRHLINFGGIDAGDCDTMVNYPEGTKGLKHQTVESVVTTERIEPVFCITAPGTGNFALDCGVFVGNCGLIVNVTPLEPGWTGQVVIEISNTTPLPAKVYGNEGICQFLFFRSEDECQLPYNNRGGKYMGQTGITLPTIKSE